ncbi:MAG: PQQ-binding-like beta-propeller repeat protein [Bryobacteraceae bacterium]|nr:PQQ-binding-like beta-propeller repeat protein [Bryobacteraceae bacterium]
MKILRTALLPALSALSLFAVVPDGSAVYRDHCASCHAAPAGRMPSKDAMRDLSTRRIVNSLESGTMFMPGRRLTPEERRSVAEYLTGKSFRIETSSKAGYCVDSRPIEPKSAVWAGWSVDVGNARYQPNGGLTSADLPNLKLKWAFGFPEEVMAFAQPSVFGGRVFVGSAGGIVYSLDAATGCIIWEHSTEAAVRTAIVIAPRSAGHYTVWFGDLHSNVYAVDAATGKLLWKKKLDVHPSARITAAPALHDGTLYVPVSSFEEGMASHPAYACCTFRGSVAALNALTGERIWQTFTVGRPMLVKGRNSQGARRFGPSGAAIWSTPTVDAKRGLLYVTTGDNYAEPSTPLSDAVIALRLKSGTVVWSKQVTLNDRWNAACLGDKVNCPPDAGPDHDFGAPAILTRTAAGKDILIAAQKSGVVYALDPDRRGEIVWKTAAGKGGPLGGIQWGHAVDYRNVYAPLSDVSLSQMTSTGGGLVALRIEDGQQVWKAPPAVCGERTPCSPAQMAAATAIPGAVLSGARDGVMRAYSSENGSVLWSYDTFRQFQTTNDVDARGGAIDGPGPIVAGGMVLFNSGYALWNGRGGNVLLAFSLPD